MSLLLSQKHKKIGIFGLGKTGVSSYEALYKVAQVICYDQNNVSRKAFSEIYGNDKLVDLSDPRWKKLDKIVLSPGVSLSHDIVKLAASNNILLTSDIELLFEEAKSVNFVAVTGTNGKSTTVALIGYILQTQGRHYPIGGNIGIPALSIDFHAPGYVLELSSFQLDLLQNFKAKIAILLNITKDHLARHGSMENYIASKRKICDRLDKESFAIISVDNEITKQFLEQLEIENRTNLLPISTRKILDKGASVYHNIIYDNIAEPLIWRLPNNKYLLGSHNQENIIASYAACRILGIKPEEIITAITEFKGLPHRMQYIGTIYSDDTHVSNNHNFDSNGRREVNFYNDSKATNTDAASKSLTALDNIYWLAGGIAKEGGIAGLEPLFHKIRKAYLFGQDKEMFAATLDKKVQYQICEDLTEAFNMAMQDAQTDGKAVKNILLAPACASFDQFKNFEERGELFIKLYNIAVHRS
ncbi:UDP-N-acetylmuramoyl-L-alanine--D-glutamate ligase [Candidatus Tisiphia endosymbiont of Beris chalybata]|uniref:UDP-N-acetylmuramoyl-L-alanine--D-glutamate ligase n=1 Tax=Candidatus Tisiphia endosymbiont of Beris chalybata TaxID=3066262 RepID=UPI00312C981F